MCRVGKLVDIRLCIIWYRMQSCDCRVGCYRLREGGKFEIGGSVMASLNKVILIGHLGADPEIRYTAAGDALCSLRLATSDTWKDKSTGERRESTEWHRVVLYRKLAETANQYLKKGSLIYLEGRIRTKKWQDKQGQDRYSTEIEANEMVMLGGKGASNVESADVRDSASRTNGEKSLNKSWTQEPAWLEDTIPF